MRRRCLLLLLIFFLLPSCAPQPPEEAPLSTAPPAAPPTLEEQLALWQAEKDPLIRTAYDFIAADVHALEAESDEAAPLFSAAALSPLTCTDRYEDLLEAGVLEVYPLSYRLTPENPESFAPPPDRPVDGNGLLTGDTKEGIPCLVALAPPTGEAEPLGVFYHAGEAELYHTLLRFLISEGHLKAQSLAHFALSELEQSIESSGAGLTFTLPKSYPDPEKWDIVITLSIPSSNYGATLSQQLFKEENDAHTWSPGHTYRLSLSAPSYKALTLEASLPLEDGGRAALSIDLLPLLLPERASPAG